MKPDELNVEMLGYNEVVELFNSRRQPGQSHEEDFISLKTGRTSTA